MNDEDGLHYKYPLEICITYYYYYTRAETVEIKINLCRLKFIASLIHSLIHSNRKSKEPLKNIFGDPMNSVQRNLRWKHQSLSGLTSGISVLSLWTVAGQ